jgi:hypothetical protein
MMITTTTTMATTMGVVEVIQCLLGDKGTNTAATAARAIQGHPLLFRLQDLLPHIPLLLLLRRHRVTTTIARQVTTTTTTTTTMARMKMKTITQLLTLTHTSAAARAFCRLVLTITLILATTAAAATAGVEEVVVGAVVGVGLGRRQLGRACWGAFWALLLHIG